MTFLVHARRAAQLAQTGLAIRSPHGDLDLDLPAPPTITAEALRSLRRGNTLAATTFATFATFGAFNASWAILQWMMLVGLVPAVVAGGNPGSVDGVLVLTFSLISLYLGLAALGQQLGLAAVLFTMALTHAFLGVWALTPQTRWVGIVGGYWGMLSALLAFFVSAALVINSAHGRALIPIPRPGRSTAPPLA